MSDRRAFAPRLAISPPSQHAPGRVAAATPPGVTLHGGTAIAWQLAHRRSIDDFSALIEQFDLDDIRKARDHAPRGMSDPRSWASWNGMVGRDEPPPMPTRRRSP